MKIAVEFDGTIVKNDFPNIGKEMPMATFVLSNLIDRGHQLILYTHRTGKKLQEAIDWCRDHDVVFWSVNSDGENHNPETADRRKIRADIFIDSRNIGGIPPWSTIYSILHPGEDFVKLRFRYQKNRIKRFLEK